jgi:hypothetical protein
MYHLIGGVGYDLVMAKPRYVAQTTELSRFPYW